VILCHGSFGALTSKTAVCILRYRRTYRPVAILDETKDGHQASEFVGDIGAGVPVVATLDQALAYRPQVLVIGIAPRGGLLPPAWRAQVVAALEHGLEVHSGLHTFLADDPEFSAAARRGRTRIWDVRRPTRQPRIASGAGRQARPLVVHTMGTDCNCGKMTTTVELAEAAKRDGFKAAFAATGQTGIMLGCDVGAPIDRIVSDFVAGAAEELVLQAQEQGADVVFVEGQGSLTHPAYSAVTLGLAHGCYPDLVVLCHQPGRTHHTGYERAPNAFPLLGLTQMRRLIETVMAPVHPTK